MFLVDSRNHFVRLQRYNLQPPFHEPGISGHFSQSLAGALVHQLAAHPRLSYCDLAEIL